MKKTTPKLTFHRETIRLLTTPKLVEVVGGEEPTTPSITFNLQKAPAPGQ